MKKNEEKVHLAVVNYIKLQYPNWIFNTDMSGIKLPIGLAAKAKKLRSNNGFPDIVIYEPRGVWKALFLEIKADDSSPFKLNGELRSNSHTQEQEALMQELRQRGYYAAFAVGFDQAKNLIDSYAQIPVFDLEAICNDSIEAGDVYNNIQKLMDEANAIMSN